MAETHDPQPNVTIPLGILVELLIHTGPDQFAYGVGLEILLETHHEQALYVLSRLYDDFRPEVVAHIVQQSGFDPDEVPDRRACVDCGVNVAYIQEAAYMVRDEVWRASGLGKRDGHLCVLCIEKRLGRRLNPDDFTAALFTTDPNYPRSDRLAARIEGRP